MSGTLHRRASPTGAYYGYYTTKLRESFDVDKSIALSPGAGHE